jgi:hypothetical protein
MFAVSPSACPFALCRGFFTPKIVGTFYMQGYKVKEKTAIVSPVSKLSGHPAHFGVIALIAVFSLTLYPCI